MRPKRKPELARIAARIQQLVRQERKSLHLERKQVDIEAIFNHRSLRNWPDSLDPRVKIALCAAGTAAVLLTLSLTVSLVIALTMLALLVISGMRVTTVCSFIIGLIPAIAISILLNALFPGSGETPFSAVSIATGFAYAMRLSALTVLIVALVRTTPTEDLARGCCLFIQPLHRYRIPVNDICFTLTLAIRFIPLLISEMRDLLIAHQLRGMLVDGSRLRQAATVSRLLIPALRGAIHRANQIADSAQSRGYRSKTPRSIYYPYRIDRNSWLVLVSGLVLFATLLIVARFR